MKLAIYDLKEALTYIIEGMYDAEKKLESAIPRIMVSNPSTSVKTELRKYADSTRARRMKIKRIFSYLLAGPFRRKNMVAEKMLEELKSTLACTSFPEIREFIFLIQFEAMLKYKIVTYHSACETASILELNEAADLLSEIIVYEKETERVIHELRITRTTKASTLHLQRGIKLQ